MRGRKPTPTALKLLTGNPGKRPVNTTEPNPPSIAPDCPEHLSAEAKQEWARISIQLLDLGLLTQLDRSALAAYCQAYGRWVAAELQIDRTSEIVKTIKGNSVQNPWLWVANRALDQMKDFLTEFGLTPVSRCRIHGATPVGADAEQNAMFGDVR